jgi:acetyl esterase/lipase
MKRIPARFHIALFALLLTPAVSWAQNPKMFERLDANRDGKLTKDEFPDRVQARFTQMDADKNGSVSPEEFAAFRQQQNAPRENNAQRQRPARGTEPTHADFSYGDHKKQAFDIWLAKTKDGKPTPLVIYIHGGGFRGGDKNADGQPVQNYLDAGISFASMNYRLSDVGPYPIMMQDAARGLQTIRSKAKEWNLDPERIACYGGSAGAGISLWLGFHEDLADPNSDDPVARQSTRIVAAGTQNGQSTYDMRTFREWFGVPNLEPHPALVTFYGVEKDSDWESDRVKNLMTDASAITHLTKDDPPVFMTYGQGDVPVNEKSSPGLWVHHARLGIKLKEAMDKLGLECHVTWKNNPDQKYADIHAFLRDKVQAK